MPFMYIYSIHSTKYQQQSGIPFCRYLSSSFSLSLSVSSQFVSLLAMVCSILHIIYEQRIQNYYGTRVKDFLFFSLRRNGRMCGPIVNHKSHSEKGHRQSILNVSLCVTAQTQTQPTPTNAARHDGRRYDKVEYKNIPRG